MRWLRKDITAHLVGKGLMLVVVLVLMMMDVIEKAGRWVARWMDGRVARILEVARAHVVRSVL